MSVASRLVLIRHANPILSADVPPDRWTLSESGRQRARALAERLDPGQATAIHSSFEPKAAETAEVLGQVWSLPVVQIPGLHEHERTAAPLVDRARFEARIRELFARPSDVVFGMESAEQALRRFKRAMTALVASTARDLLVVTHGTVMSLFIAEATGVRPFELWKSLGLPCAVTLTTCTWRIRRRTGTDGAVR